MHKMRIPGLCIVALTCLSVCQVRAATTPGNSLGLQRARPLLNVSASTASDSTLHFNPPSNPTDFQQVSDTNALHIGDTVSIQPERDYYAALVAAQAKNLGDLLDGGGHLDIRVKTVEYRRFGVRIYFDNFAKEMTFELVGEMLEALAVFMWRTRLTECRFSLVDLERRGLVISNGGIERIW